MPIYEYRCLDCQSEHEFIQKFSDPPKTKCPKCGGKLEKLISNTSFVLKGSGWYVTDYASGDRKSKMDSDKPSKPTGGSKSENKTDSKPEAKSGGDKASSSTESK